MTTPNTIAFYHVGRRSYRVPEIAHRNGVSRAFVYKQIAEGRLRARKGGAATIVTDEDEAAWIAGMPDLVALNAADASADKYPTMGKRSKFDRIPHDLYVTPPAAVLPLLPWLAGIDTFAEPCCGEGALVRHLESHGLRCVYQGDITTGQDALAIDSYGDADAIVTNPPWTRKRLHPLIQHFQQIAPTWLLLDSDWANTKQAAPYLATCSNILPIGRVVWIAGTGMPGKDNAAWYRFDQRHTAGPVFHPYRSAPLAAPSLLLR